jgi:PleD family two-component response regulator
MRGRFRAARPVVPHQRGAKAARESRAMTSISVLIVDDEENVRSALRRTLRKSPEHASEAAHERPKLVHSRPVAAARVLIVEDSRTQAEWLAQVLSREGYEVRMAADGREAIRQVRSDPPDLVLLDMILPDMDGLEVLRIVKARADDQFIPVILLSVKSDLDSRVAGLRIGADDFLAKPFADAEIQARAAAMLRIKVLQDQLRSAKSQLEKLSVTDGLTGLYNHRHFAVRRRGVRHHPAEDPPAGRAGGGGAHLQGAAAEDVPRRPGRGRRREARHHPRHCG